MLMCRKNAWCVANSVDPDQMLHYAVSDLGLQFAQACLSKWFGKIWHLFKALYK